MAAIKFYSASDALYGCFSNFSNHAVFINGKEYPTTEHYFQVSNFKKINNGLSKSFCYEFWFFSDGKSFLIFLPLKAQKFAGTEYEETVRLAKTPAEAKELGRGGSLRADWEQVSTLQKYRYAP
jgi:predicted NAD-dependent protein-ADP-ribosyltransferase YbiA (DUF1768 family)